MKIKRFNEAQEQLSDAERKFLAALFEMKPEIEDFVSSVNKLIQVGEIESDVAAKFMIEIGEDPDQLDLPVVSSTSHLVEDDEDVPSKKIGLMKIKRFTELNEAKKPTLGEVYTLLKEIRDFEETETWKSGQLNLLKEKLIKELVELKPDWAVYIIKNLIDTNNITGVELDNYILELEHDYDYQKWVVENDPESLERILPILNKKVKQEYPHLIGVKRTGII